MILHCYSSFVENCGYKQNKSFNGEVPNLWSVHVKHFNYYLITNYCWIYWCLRCIFVHNFISQQIYRPACFLTSKLSLTNNEMQFRGKSEFAVKNISKKPLFSFIFKMSIFQSMTALIAYIANIASEWNDIAAR